MLLEENPKLDLPIFFDKLSLHPKDIHLTTNANATNLNSDILVVTISPWEKVPRGLDQLTNLRKLELTGSTLDTNEREKIEKLVPNECLIVWK